MKTFTVKGVKYACEKGAKHDFIWFKLTPYKFDGVCERAQVFDGTFDQLKSHIRKITK